MSRKDPRTDSFDTVRLFAASNGIPYKPKPSVDTPVMMMHTGAADVHPLVEQAPAVDALLAGSCKFHGATVFMVDVSRVIAKDPREASYELGDSATSGFVGRQLLKWYQKFNCTNGVIVARGDLQTRLLFRALQTVTSTVCCVIVMDARPPPFHLNVDLIVVGENAGWEKVAHTSAASLNDAVLMALGDRAEDWGDFDKFYVSVDFTLDKNTKQLKQTATNINEEVEYLLKNATAAVVEVADVGPVEPKKVKGPAVKRTELVQTLRPGSVFRKLEGAVLVNSSTTSNDALRRCVIGDASGSVDCLFPAACASVVTKGAVVAISGRCVSVGGKTMIMAETVEAQSALKTEGYEEQLSMSHANQLSKLRRSYGLLLMRGAKVVLCRDKSWTGMRVPYLQSAAEETPEDTAVRAAMKLCDINDEEFYISMNLPTVTYYLPDEIVTLYMGFATRPPPADAPPDDYEESSDEEDTYDWYTFSQAYGRLRSMEEKRALVTAAQALHAAVEHGALYGLYGGIFGEECRSWVPSTGLSVSFSS